MEGNEGYVQGMSDLCAPIYVVMGGEPEMTFWCFVEVMDRMVSSVLVSQGVRYSYLSDRSVETKLHEGPEWDEEATVDSPTIDRRYGP